MAADRTVSPCAEVLPREGVWVLEPVSPRRGVGSALGASPSPPAGDCPGTARFTVSPSAPVPRSTAAIPPLGPPHVGHVAPATRSAGSRAPQDVQVLWGMLVCLHPPGAPVKALRQKEHLSCPGGSSKALLGYRTGGRRPASTRRREPPPSDRRQASAFPAPASPLIVRNGRADPGHRVSGLDGRTDERARAADERGSSQRGRRGDGVATVCILACVASGNTGNQGRQS